MTQATVESVLRRNRDRLISIKGVVGTAVGDCHAQPCIKIYVLRKNQKLLRDIPTELDGYPVCIEATGEFRASK